VPQAASRAGAGPLAGVRLRGQKPEWPCFRRPDSLTTARARRSIVVFLLPRSHAMNPFETHGAFSWSELMTSDPKAACDFYAKLFGWKVETMDMGNGPYHVLKVGDAAIGGIMGNRPGTPADMPPMWGCYVTVSNLDETIGAAKRLGGSVLMEPVEVKTVGRMAVIRDAQGAALSVIQYRRQ
jgi:predicted enzyme related to lactoylglutathione lyase